MTAAVHALIADYGVWAVFGGCLMEGETFAVAGGFFAHQKTLVLPEVVAAAAIGSTLGDLALYLAGRYFASVSFVQRAIEKPLFSRAMALLRRNETLFILTNRFIYGLRSSGGVAIGLAGVSPLKFMLLNMVSALIWTALFVGSGYLFGASIEALIGRGLHGHERLILGAGLLIGVAVAALLAIRHYRKGAGSGSPGETG